MALRAGIKRSQGSSIDIESTNSSAEAELVNRNAELEVLVSSLKRMLDISRRRERKLVKALEDIDSEALYRLDLDDSGGGDAEPSFFRSLGERSLWLIGLLVFQSLSSYILRRNEALLQQYPVIVYFLTMLVGAGGNAGNQACVRVIRGLALNTLSVSWNNRQTYYFFAKECLVSIIIGTVLGTAGFLRVYGFSGVNYNEAIAVSLALFVIVVVSIVAGCLLPMFFFLIGIDPAHSSSAIQVVMDISGVVITCAVAASLLQPDAAILPITAQDILPQTLSNMAQSVLPSIRPTGLPIT